MPFDKSQGDVYNDALFKVEERYRSVYVFKEKYS